MNLHKNELEVDFIGGNTPLTEKEEKAISEFIKSAKVRQQKQTAKGKSRTSNKSFPISKALSTNNRS